MHLIERNVLDRLCVRYGVTYRNGPYTGRRFTRAEHVPTDPTKNSGRIADFIATDSFAIPWTKMTDDEKSAAGDSYVKSLSLRRSIHGHEIKVNRPDLLAELRNPEKASAWTPYCHYWWLVVPDRKIIHDDLPDGWGLMVFHGSSLRVICQATRTDVEPMPSNLAIGLVRATSRTEARLASQDSAGKN